MIFVVYVVLLAEEESEMHTDLHQQSPIPTQLEEEREGEEEEEGEVAIDVEGKLEQEPMAADSTTIRSSSPEVTSTHQRQGPSTDKPFALYVCIACWNPQ